MSAPGRRARGAKIKAPRKHGQEINADQIWATLSKNIREIQAHNAANLSFEENYRYGYNLVLYKYGEMLYNGVMRLVAENLEALASEKIVPVFPAASSGDIMQKNKEGEMLLKALRSVWDEHTSNMDRLGQILKYMDRVYSKEAGAPETWDAGLSLFLKHIICDPIKEHLVNAILNQVKIERQGYAINRSAVKGCVYVFLTLHVANDGTTVYTRDLEPILLRESTEFYEDEGKKSAAECDASEYLRKAEDRLRSEESRTAHYLSRQTFAPLLQILKDTLLTAHLEIVISKPESGLDTMIDLDKCADLERMYRLFTMVPTGLPCLKRHLKGSISRRGKEINQKSVGVDTEDVAADDPKGKSKVTMSGSQTLTLALQWVQDVLNLKDKFDKVWRVSFSSDREIEAALNEAFETFVNSNEKCSEYISLFIDDHLKRGLKGKSEAEVDAILEKTIIVFRFLTEKDVFERYYKSHLAKRLLYGRSVSDDAERGMLARLKVECGVQFTQKLEGMFNDMRVSSDSMDAYKTHLESREAPSVDLSVIVMTSTFWPMTHSSSQCNFPLDLIKTSQSFERFYLSRHSGRRLTWQPSLGNVDVRVAFNKRKHDLNVSTFGLVILLLFEDLKDDDFLTFSEIKEATGIDDGDLQRQLQSLACAKYKILKKSPPGRDVHPDDSFSFNADFSAPLQKIKIGTVSARVESGEERKETNDRIDEERKHQTEACIVRVMKDRKHMQHNDLVNEVTRLLSARFQPNPNTIKKRIEGLIEREYLERCEDRRSYNYLA